MGAFCACPIPSPELLQTLPHLSKTSLWDRREKVTFLPSLFIRLPPPHPSVEPGSQGAPGGAA
jgi:hypothetical protein